MRTSKAPRVALIHYWLVGMRGGEKVLESLCRMFPDADIFTHVALPEKLSSTIRRHKIIETNIAQYPFSKRYYQNYLPLMPRALEALDLRGYDLVISSESGPAKGVIAPPDAPHLCYCHSPMRYIWDQFHVYREQAGPVRRAMMPLLAHGLRQWDVSAAARVDGFVANSSHVAQRIQKYWRRDSTVVAPPVDVSAFAPAPRAEISDSYLWVGDLASYKRPDLMLRAFRQMDLPLNIIGGSKAQIRNLSPLAGPRTRFLGHVDTQTLRYHLSRCQALIFPGEEDFGIVPVEAMAAGRPVIAYGRGGVLDTVIDGQTGVFFDQPSVDSLVDAIDRFQRSDLASAEATIFTSQAGKFTEARFQAGIVRALKKIGFDENNCDFPLPVRLASG